MTIGIMSPAELIADGGRFSGAAIVDARRRGAFLTGHIPGAVSMGWESWCQPPPALGGPALAREGYWGVLEPIAPEACGLRLASLGLSDDRAIVVYADGPMSKGREGRIAWMLLYFGARHVSLLDGGWSAWLAAGGEVESGEPTPRRGRMRVRHFPERRRTLDELRTAYREGKLPTLVDTRSATEFAGEIESYMPRRGHLPGAQLLNFADLFDGDGRYSTAEAYTAILPSTIRGATSMIAYCEVGVRASLFALLHEIHTGNIVRVYDGSLVEWGLQCDLPVESL